MLESAEFWVAVSFVVFVVALWKPASGALTGALDARAVRIKAELDQAAKLRDEAQALLVSYRQKHKESVREAEDMVVRAKAEAERHAAQAVKDLEAALKRREELAMQRIAQAEAQAAAEVRAVAVDAAISATRKLLAESLEGQRADALIDQAIAELPQKLH